ncbi:MAG: hypothetical protein O7J95_19935 [Planctomycetota bacterium]|nr:hypothetical protein [Planctomycetota bacterium]
MQFSRLIFLTALILGPRALPEGTGARTGELRLLRARPDPYGYPRPAPGQTDVPVATSFFLQVGFDEKGIDDVVLPDSIVVRLARRGEAATEILKRGQEFARGYSGTVAPGKQRRGPALAVNIDGETDLRPSTTYVVSVSARSRGGAELAAREGSWEFTTEAANSERRRISFGVDLSVPPVHWRGGFFTGFCKPSFCTSASNRLGGYRLMDRLRQQYPGAWSLQRDFTMTSMERQPRFLSTVPPNVVREQETRRIRSMSRSADGVLLRVEDFFGHEQYGIPSGRPISGDFHPGDEVLIADGVRDARARVVRVAGDRPGARSLLVTSFDDPPGGWKIEYSGPLPEKENPDAPGLFPPGGCYLIKFRPAGTPRYFWGRLDREWDIAHRDFRRRLVVNFAEAPGDLAVDGRDWTYPKDYPEYHEVVRSYTSHLIERYGDACLTFYWSVFNEPDLASLFWRSGDWSELQKFYDYSVDAILRAFEDHGHDSRKVLVGGLELAAIFGTHLRLREFLSHCSPRSTASGALSRNAAFADRRLDGKRSSRLEALCRAHEGRGSPCDFISIHSYNASEMTAAKLIRAKQMALETDADYFADLRVNSFESCPGWAPPPDVAAADSYLGNGYFPTWCADVTRRLLEKAARDGRYAFGETILTFWPWPNKNFGGHNAATRVISVDEDGDGRTDRRETVAMPILNFLGLLSAMGDDYWVLREEKFGGHVVSGFASRDGRTIRALLYSHDQHDIQSRSKAAFDVELRLEGVPWRRVSVKEHRFDRDSNSYYRRGRELRERTGRAGARGRPPPDPGRIEQLMNDLESGDREKQLAALREAASFGRGAGALVRAAIPLYRATRDRELRAAMEEAARQILDPDECYSADEVARIRELSVLRTTRESFLDVGADGALRLLVSVAGNGANVVVIEAAETARARGDEDGDQGEK